MTLHVQNTNANAQNFPIRAPACVLECMCTQQIHDEQLPEFNIVFVVFDQHFWLLAAARATTCRSKKPTLVFTPLLTTFTQRAVQTEAAPWLYRGGAKTEVTLNPLGVLQPLEMN